MFILKSLDLTGLVVLMTTILGCCGIMKTSRSMVLTYSIVLVIIFLIEIGAGVMAYMYRRQLSTELADNLTEKFNTRYGIDNDTTEAVDHLQIRYWKDEIFSLKQTLISLLLFSLECCGVHDFMDWQSSAWFELPQRRNNKVPDSCCISPGRYCGVRDHPSNIRYTGV